MTIKTKIRACCVLFLGLGMGGIVLAAADISQILKSGNENAAEEVCDAASGSADRASDAIVITARNNTALLKPVMECIYWRVEPAVFDEAVTSAVAVLRNEGGLSQ